MLLLLLLFECGFHLVQELDGFLQIFSCFRQGQVADSLMNDVSSGVSLGTFGASATYTR